MSDLALDAQTVRDALNRLPMCAHSRQELGCFLCDAHNELDRLVASVEAPVVVRERLYAAEARVVALTSDNAKLEHKARYTMKMLHAADHAHHERTRLIDAAEARVVALTAERDKLKTDTLSEPEGNARATSSETRVSRVDLASPALEASEAATPGNPSGSLSVSDTARLLSLEEALRRYGWHREGCGYNGSGPESCTCGFSTALAASAGDTA